MTTFSQTIVLVSRNGMGHAEPALSHKLLNSYFDLLVASNSLPDGVCFYAEGVKLAVNGSPVLDALRALEEKGVPVSVCSTCLNHYGLMKDLKVGKPGNMLDLIEKQKAAKKIVAL